MASAVEKVYNRSVATALQLRSRRDILRFFDGFGVVDPGLVYIPNGGQSRAMSYPSTRATTGTWSAWAGRPDRS